jgi:hypothetical protein
MDRPVSRTDTVRPAAPTPRTPSFVEREGFLSAALARLSLTPRPPTPAVLPTVASSSEESENPTVAHLETLASETSRPAAERGGGGQADSIYSLSGTRTSDLTRSFLDGTISRDEQESLAGEYVTNALFSDDDSFVGTQSQRLLFYQALVIQFGAWKLHSQPRKRRSLLRLDVFFPDLADVEDVPDTITQCKKLLVDVHISIRECLEVVERGGNVGREVTRVSSLFPFPFILLTLLSP